MRLPPFQPFSCSVVSLQSSSLHCVPMKGLSRLPNCSVFLGGMPLQPGCRSRFGRKWFLREPFNNAAVGTALFIEVSQPDPENVQLMPLLAALLVVALQQGDLCRLKLSKTVKLL